MSSTAALPDTAFEVEIASTGQVFPIPAGQSVLHTLMLEGFDIPFACEEGVCGTCLTGVKSGEVDHRDHYLTPEEQATPFLTPATFPSSNRISSISVLSIKVPP